jgi:glycosyltransferase involved in cell wall biosynthesis
MKILILSQYYWPESFRINDVAASLRDVGCEVTVLTGQPNYPDGQTFSGYRAWSIRREVHEKIPIHRVPLAPRGRASAGRLVANYLSFLTTASLIGPWLLRHQRFDVVFVYGVSPILKIFAALAVRRRTGGVLVTWVQDLWPQSLQVTGHVRSPRVLGAVAAVVRWLYRRNDLILVQSQGFVPIVAAMAGSTPVEYHPNPGEQAFMAPPGTTAALELQPGFNVVFAGNLGTVQALDTVLAAAGLLREEPDVRFVLIGSGSHGEWLEREVRRLGLTNVQLPGRFAPQDMPSILAQASALLVSLTRDTTLSQTVPSKIQAYLASGRPMIASLDGEGARVVKEACAGPVCPAEDAPALANAVRALHALSPEERAGLGRAGRSYYLKHFEPGMLAGRLVQRLAALIASNDGTGEPAGINALESDNG